MTYLHYINHIVNSTLFNDNVQIVPRSISKVGIFKFDRFYIIALHKTPEMRAYMLHKEILTNHREEHHNNK